MNRTEKFRRDLETGRISCQVTLKQGFRDFLSFCTMATLIPGKEGDAPTLELFITEDEFYKNIAKDALSRMVDQVFESKSDIESIQNSND